MWNQDIPSLRILIVGGEDCPGHIVKQWCTTGRRMFNTYGPTEATVIATYSILTPDKPVTIGKPVPNYMVYILDENMNPVKEGEEGKLFIGGVGLARGYVNQKELTKQKFVDNPFYQSKFDSKKLYRTGDLVRLNGEREIEILGRVDSQIKIRGFRVELSEIETVIMSVLQVQNTVVNLYEQSPGLLVLVAYLIFENKSDINIPKISESSFKKNRLSSRNKPSIVDFCYTAAFYGYLFTL